MTTTDITLPSEQVAIADQSIGQLIQTLRPEIQRAAPKGMSGDRIARLALTVVRQSDIAARKAGKPEQSLARANPESFLASLLTATALGLEPGVNGEAYLVSYRKECTLIIGYQGLVKLFYQHPLARFVDAHAVYANDMFDYSYGTEPYLRHKPTDGERGAVERYYAVASLSTGAAPFAVLTADEVKALRSGKVGSSGDIADPQRWMERKTVLRQLLKTLPKSTQLQHALDVDEKTGTDLRSWDAPAAITAETTGGAA